MAKRVVHATCFVIISVLLSMVLEGCIAVGRNDTENAKEQHLINKGEKIMYKKMTLNMMVEDMDRTLDFYVDVLKFDFVIGVPENSQDIVNIRQENQPLQFAIMKSGNIDLMFQTKKCLTGEISQFEGTNIGSSSILYIEVEDVKKLYEELKDKVTIVKDIEAKFYGKQEFYLRDCNGYILGFAGDI
jgi:uncharacterized glyoxalase superfamily protein PhnB